MFDLDGGFTLRITLNRLHEAKYTDPLTIIMNDQTTRLAGVDSDKRTEVAVLAGGCFRGVEEILRDARGILDTEVGYTGVGSRIRGYEDTHDSESGHAEAIRVTFDPEVLSYEELLEKWFFKLHDPTPQPSPLER